QQEREEEEVRDQREVRAVRVRDGESGERRGARDAREQQPADLLPLFSSGPAEAKDDPEDRGGDPREHEQRPDRDQGTERGPAPEADRVRYGDVRVGGVERPRAEREPDRREGGAGDDQPEHRTPARGRQSSVREEQEDERDLDDARDEAPGADPGNEPGRRQSR